MSVFNLDQVDDAGSKISKEDKIASWGGDPKEINERIQPVEEWVKSTGATIQHGGNTAAYSSSLDKIFMPHLEDFFTPEAYYSTLIHELVHWTGHNTRLDRKLVNQFGSEAYAFEELIAEIGSTSLGEELGINPDLKNHASYLNSWIKILKGDKKAFFKAASLAQKASEFLNK
jgi:antirestriction protein ArdC